MSAQDFKDWYPDDPRELKRLLGLYRAAAQVLASVDGALPEAVSHDQLAFLARAKAAGGNEAVLGALIDKALFEGYSAVEHAPPKDKGTAPPWQR